MWGSVLATGLLFGLVGCSPLLTIVAAQAANGVLLLLIAAFLLYLTPQQLVVEVPTWYALLDCLWMLICAGLGLRTLWWVGQQL